MVYKWNSLEPKGSGEVPLAADGEGLEGGDQAERIGGFSHPLQPEQLHGPAIAVVERAWVSFQPII